MSNILKRIKSLSLTVIYSALFKSLFTVILPTVILFCLIGFFENDSNSDIKRQEQLDLSDTLSKIAWLSNPEHYFNSEFQKLKELPYPSASFDKRLRQIHDAFPGAFIFCLFDTSGTLIPMDFGGNPKKFVSQKYLETVKDTSKTQKNQRYLKAFSGYESAHMLLNDSPNKILEIGTSHDNRWAGWFTLKDEEEEYSGDLIVFISRKHVKDDQMMEKAINFAGDHYGRTISFAWQNPVFPDKLNCETGVFTKEEIDLLNSMAIGENIAYINGKCGCKIVTDSGAVLIGLNKYPTSEDITYSLIRFFIAFFALGMLCIMLMFYLQLLSLSSGFRTKLGALIIFGVSLPLVILLVTGMIDRREREKILVNKYEQKNIDDLTRIDEALINDYRKIERHYKTQVLQKIDLNNGLNVLLNSASDQFDRLIKTNPYNLYINRMIFVTKEKSLAFLEDSKKISVVDSKSNSGQESMIDYGQALIDILNGEYQEKKQNGNDSGTIIQNMGGVMNRSLITGAGTVRYLNLMESNGMTYFNFLYTPDYRAMGSLFIFMNDYMIQSHYLYRISKLRDEAIRRDIMTPRFMAIPISNKSQWKIFPKKATASVPQVAELANQTSKAKVPMHKKVKIRGEKYLLSAMCGNNLNGYILMTAQPYQVIDKQIQSLKKKLSSLATLILILALGTTYFSSSLLMKPMETLQKGLKAVATGDFRCRLPDSPVAEFSSMLETLNTTMYQLGELKVAKTVQENLLPDKGLNGSDWELIGKTSTATELGGDHIDWLQLADGRVLIVLGDVTGHGIAPAMVMASMKVWLALHAEKATDSVSLVKEINRLHVTYGAKRLKMTAWFGYYSPDTGELEFTSAGHPYPFVVTDEGDISMIKLPGMPIGSTLRIRLKSQKIILQPGSSLILYTDGFAEVQNPVGQMLGFDGFSAICASTKGMSASDTINTIFSKAALWGKQNDDQTLVVLRRNKV